MAGHVFGRSSRDDLPIAVDGDGCYIVTADGERYLDGSGGAAVSCLGHSNERVRAAMHAQLDRLAFAHTGFFTSEPAEHLADLLTRYAPEGIDRVYLLSGGSEVVETAIKLARQYALEIGEPERHRLIARRQSYHGNTLGALAAGGNAWRREKYAPLLVETHHVSPCYAYRGKHDGESDADYASRLADELESEIVRLGPETVLAFIAEPVVGATAGAVPPVPGYFRRIREVCDRYGVLLILDEIMCGMGRTGTLFACEQDGIRPDILTIAKGVGAGYAPLSAMLCQGFIHDAIAGGSGAFQHGHTYHGHSLAAAAGVAVMEELTDGGLADRAATMGARLMAALEATFGQHPHVGDIRGRGMFRGIELVADRDTKAPLDPSRKTAARVKSAAMDERLIVYPASGTIDGRQGDHILIAPPFIISDDEIDELAGRLSRALDTALT